MIRLVTAEFKRLAARRITRYFPLTVAGLMIAGIAIALQVINSNDDSVDFVNDIAGGPDATSILGPVTILFPLMAFVIGASYMGADIKTGMLEHLLTWEPRRLRLLAARAVSLFVVAAVLTMILATFFVALLYLLAALTGTVDGTSGELWGNIAKLVLRSGLAAGIFSALGVGATILVNNSIASIVGFVIYWFVAEPLVGTFLPKWGIYLPIENANALSEGRPAQRIEGDVFGGFFDIVDEHSATVAGLILTGWAVLALIVGGVVFSRRDIA